MAGRLMKAWEREELQRVARKTRDAAVLRRAEALLSVDDGERPTSVSRRLAVHRSTVYDWMAMYRDRSRASNVEQRLTDRHRSGRRPRQLKAAMAEIGELLAKAPAEFGYQHRNWTAGLLRRHLRVEHGLSVSDTTVRRAIHTLGYRWKRPRFVLSRRSPTWRQAKGGSKEG